MVVKRHVDYVKSYSKNLTPVIPHDATLSPKSKIHPANRGKVPGQRKSDGTWYGGWGKMGDATLALAEKWDRWGAFIGFRGGFASVFALDIDLTHRADADKVLAIAHECFGKRLSVRRVDHPEHTKLLICLRLEGVMPASFNVSVKQSDGKSGGIQFLGPGRYFNIHGTHPKRLAPYIWVNDPADVELTLVNNVELDAFWARLGQEFEILHRPRTHAPNEVQREPEHCTSEEMEKLLELIPNDAAFEDYGPFVTMGAAIFGASAGAAWGRAQWFAWCDQVEQLDDMKPETFWDSMRQARTGAEHLRNLANQRDPYEMARRAFETPEIEPEELEEAQAAIDERTAFLEGWVLVGGSDYYALPPRRVMKADAFNRIHLRAMQGGLRRALGGAKKSTAAGLFALHSPNLVADIVHEPGKPRFIVEDGVRVLNLWTPPPRPHRDKPITPAVIEAYRDLVEFVMGSADEAALWIKWHAWMLQNPSRPPGWQWLVHTDPGKGKDLALLPVGLAHGDDYTPVNPQDLIDRFNDYAEKHLISTSEMRERGRTDAYLKLKAITSGAPKVSIRAAYAKRHLAANVAGFIIFSNEEHPLKIDHDDRRMHVVANFERATRPAEYYRDVKAMLLEHWAMISEYLHTLTLSAADLDMLIGNAPSSEAKTEMAEQVAEQALRDIIGEIESDKPPPYYLPVATTGEIRDWLEKIEKLRPHETPDRNELLTLLYRLGARPVIANRQKPKRAEPIDGARLWRIARFWTDQAGVRWDLEASTPSRLAKLYSDKVMPPAGRGDFKVAEDEI